MTLSEIRSAIARKEADPALRALRDLVVRFLDATYDTRFPESLKAMSIDQIRLLNQISVAVEADL